MIGTVIIAAIVALLISSLGTLMALKIQYRYLQRTHVQHKAWEQAQEAYQRNWEVKQEKHTLAMQANLVARVQQIEEDWQAWEKKDTLRVEALTQQYTETSTAQHIERELARLPLVEETPLAFNSNGQHLPEFSHWQPPALARADLSERDLSYRYLGQADLREAQLRGASFFMSDLSGACLAGANLTGADLTGANLAYADLRNSVLTQANLQVADLSHAVLLGANLHSARNLTTQQVYAAIYDHTTLLDTDVDLTMPRLPSMTRSMLKPTSSAQAPAVKRVTLISVAPETIEPAALTEVEAPAFDTAAPPVLQAQPVQASTEMIGSISAEITEISETSARVENTEVSTTSEDNGVITEIPVLEAPEEMEVPTSEEAVVLTEDAETPTLQEELVVTEIEHITPLVFPHSIEVIEEDDSFVLPAFKQQSTEEVSPSPASEPQPVLEVSEPEQDFSFPQALDGSAEDQKAAHVPANVRKSKHPTPIDITTQKGKYTSNSKKRARAR